MSEQQDKPFKVISSKEYEIQINGRTKTLFIPFGTTEAIFKSFVSGGGVIDPTTGAVQQDILSLINSFREIGNLLLAERDEQGNITKEGNCANLESSEVVALFQLATHVIESFIKTLAQMKPQSQPEEEKESKTKKKA